jgi:hypothetical protein
MFTEGYRPFAYTQQLRDQARRWLVPDWNTAEEVMEQVALERFIEGLPARTSAWVWYHRPEGLSAAVDLAESHPPKPSDGPAISNTGPQHRCSCPGAGQANPGAEGKMGGLRFRAGT